MKLSIIAILISISTIAYSQGRFVDEAKAAREKTNEMLGLIQPIGHISQPQWAIPITPEGRIGTHEIAIYDPKEVFKEMLTGYLQSRDSVEVHFTSGMFCFVTTHPGTCANRDHYRMEIQTPTFQGFINYVLNLK